MQRTAACLISLLALTTFTAGAARADRGDRWSETIERISAGIVAIQVDATRAFDTEWNQSAQATGFIVDAERGLILTNRHVVTPGPVVAQAVFLNREEVELTPVYRDPVHDFGFYRFDPKALRFIQPVELPLAPQRAVIGREIRVIGNDAGEQLSILAGTLARLDRQAPEYGPGQYNDFNTFYYQAASGTSGGSSGSPVIDIDGQVVALNAGANTGAASSFFLPLDRVQRALQLIQAGQPVGRGTLQTVFVHRPFDELNRLGLDDEAEAGVRAAFPAQTGMLVVDQVIPGAPAQHLIDPGDILVRLNGELIADFSALAKVLDDRAGKTVEVELQRGGVTRRHVLQVDDLHALTPAEYIEFGDGVVHQLSFQAARHYNMAPNGIYVANPGYALGAVAVPRGAVITELNGVPTPTLDDFQHVLEGLADRERARVRFYTYEDTQTTTLRVMYNDRRWFPAQRCRRDDASGFWPCEALPPAPPDEPLKPASAQFTPSDEPRIRALAPSLVMVQFDMPYTVSGISERNYYGTGLIVDTERGYVVVDRNTVPVSLGDVKFTFASSLEIPGKVEYIHPQHNLAVVSYDPRLIGDTPVRAARFDARPVRPGERLWVVGLRADQGVASQASEVASVEPAQFPLSRTMRFRDSNIETISLVNPPGDYDGVLADERGRVVSLWSSFAFQSGRELEQTNMGVAADIVLEMLDVVRADRDLRSLEVELNLIPLASARKLGLSDAWVDRLVKENPGQRQVLSVIRLVAGSPAEKALEPGDLLLAVDDAVVSRFRGVERAVQKERVRLTLWRDGAERQVEVDTVALAGQDVSRVVMWAGALLQAPHREMAAQRGIPPVGVYIAYFSYGSPANRYNLWAGRRILAIDEQPTPDLDAFVAAVADKGDGDSVRVRAVNWNGTVEVITLKLDERYWPRYELRLSEDGRWQRGPIAGSTHYARGAPAGPGPDALSADP